MSEIFLSFSFFENQFSVMQIKFQAFLGFVPKKNNIGSFLVSIFGSFAWGVRGIFMRALCVPGGGCVGLCSSTPLLMPRNG